MIKESVTKIFNDLDAYKKFCVMFGRPFNEKALYDVNNKHYADYIESKNRRLKVRIDNGWKRDQYVDKR